MAAAAYDAEVYRAEDLVKEVGISCREGEAASAVVRLVTLAPWHFAVSGSMRVPERLLEHTGPCTESDGLSVVTDDIHG